MMSPAKTSQDKGVIVFGTYSFANHPRLQVLIEGLRAENVEVTELNAPFVELPIDRAQAVLSIRTAARTAAKYVRSIGRLTVCRFRLRPGNYIVIVPYLGIIDVVVARLLFPNRFIVWDDLAPVSQTIENRYANNRFSAFCWRKFEALASRCASVVMYDTIEQMHEIVRRRSAHAAIAVRVGASDIWHKSADIRVPSRVPSSRKDGNCLKLIYFGTYVPLHGASVFGDALAECLARGSNIQVTLVGVGSDRKSVEQALAPFSSSVRWIDWLNGPELVRAVANSDLSLGIFSTSRKAALVVPNKAYQSIAAGTPIVTSRTNVQQKMLGRAALYTEAGNARALADLLNQIASDRSAVGAAQMEAMRMRHAFRPQAVATEFLAQLPIKL